MEGLSQRKEGAYVKRSYPGLEGQEGLKNGGSQGSEEWGEGKKVPDEGNSTWKVPESSRNIGYPTMVTRPTGPELKGACHTSEQFSSVRRRAKLERVRQNARLQCRVSTQDFVKRESSGYI